MLYFIVFRKQIVHICICCFYAGSCRCHFLDLDNFLGTHFTFCCFCRRCMIVTLFSTFLLPCYSFSWCCFCSVQSLIFLQWKSASCINLHMLVFVLFELIAWFFASCFLIHVHTAPHIRCFAIISPLHPLWPPWQSLPITWCFVGRHHTCKICPDRRFSPRFRLFSCSPVQIHPIAPLRTHLHPSGAVCDHFGLVWQNMMLGEISPAIGPKSGPVRP